MIRMEGAKEESMRARDAMCKCLDGLQKAAKLCCLLGKFNAKQPFHFECLSLDTSIDTNMGLNQKFNNRMADSMDPDEMGS